MSFTTAIEGLATRREEGVCPPLPTVFLDKSALV